MSKRVLWIQYLRAVEKMILARNSYFKGENENDYEDYYRWKGRAAVLKEELIRKRKR